MINKMQEIRIEKIVLSVGGTADNLDKGIKLMERITGKKAVRKISSKRIPTLGVRPVLAVGGIVTIRGEKAIELLRRLLAAEDNKIRRRQISENSFTFGIKEYIEIPGMQYQRDIGLRGLECSVTFIRPGKRVIRKKIKKGRLPLKQIVKKEEILEYLANKLGVNLVGKA